MAVDTYLERIKKVGTHFVNGFTISDSVGDWAKGARNVPEDVEAVQLLLEYAARKHGRNEFSPKGIDRKISRIPGRSGTVKAIRAYQQSFMQSSDGLVESEGRTLQALRQEVTGGSTVAPSAAKSVMRTPNGDNRPPWLNELNGFDVFRPLTLLPGNPSPKPEWISIAEEELGQAEVMGKENNPRIIEYHAATKYAPKEDRNPWCASFVNWVLKKSGYEGTNSGKSHSFKKWGDGIPTPAVGCIGFIDWGKIYPDKPKKQGKGHVGFVVGKTPKNRIVMLGGNQDNKVCYNSYKASLFHAFRVPKGFTPSPEQFDLPIMEVSEDGGGYTSTR